jgi:hypothetical protein
MSVLVRSLLDHLLGVGEVLCAKRRVSLMARIAAHGCTHADQNVHIPRWKKCEQMYVSTQILSIPRVKSDKRSQSMSEVSRNRTQFMALRSLSMAGGVLYTMR